MLLKSSLSFYKYSTGKQHAIHEKHLIEQIQIKFIFQQFQPNGPEQLETV